MPAATSLPDPLDRDHLARLVGRASELRRSLTVIAERIANRESEADPFQSAIRSTKYTIDARFAG